MKNETEYDRQEDLRKDVQLYVPAVLTFWHQWIGTLLSLGVVGVVAICLGALPTIVIPYLVAIAAVIAPFSAWRAEKNAKLTAQNTLKEIDDIDKKEREATFNAIVEAYIDYPANSDNSLYRLIKCGATKLTSEDELARLCAVLQNRQGLEPFHDWQTIPAGQRLAALKHIRDTGTPINNWKDQIHFIISYLDSNPDTLSGAIKSLKQHADKQKPA
jgi:hypothetical protein